MEQKKIIATNNETTRIYKHKKLKRYPYLFTNQADRLNKDFESPKSKITKKWLIKLGIEIATARVHASLSQTDLAKKLKTKQSNIARLENGKSVPSLTYLEKISKITKCTFVPPSFIFGKPIKK